MARRLAVRLASFLIAALYTLMKCCTAAYLFGGLSLKLIIFSAVLLLTSMSSRSSDRLSSISPVKKKLMGSEEIFLLLVVLLLIRVLCLHALCAFLLLALVLLLRLAKTIEDEVHPQLHRLVLPFPDALCLWIRDRSTQSCVRELHTVALDLRCARSQMPDVTADGDDVAQVVVRQSTELRRLEYEVVVFPID